MPILTQAAYTVGNLCVRYQAPEDKPGAWGLTIFPKGLMARVEVPREFLTGAAVQCLPAPWNETRAWEVDPLVHLHVSGDAYPSGFAQGKTLRNSSTTQSLSVRAHTCERREGKLILRTTLATAGGVECHHELIVDETTAVIDVRTTVKNTSERPITLEYVSAFSLGGLTPFARDDAAERLHVHRFRSAWSAEARHEVRTVEELQLERSWTGHGVRAERFGQVGSLPVNGWFPFVALEDSAAHVTWAVQLSTPGTWNLEIYRRADQLALGGSGADRLSGEWRKTLQPGERFAAPVAHLTCVEGGIDEACDRLLAAARKRAQARPSLEEELPVVFNEWCTSWGHPTHDSLVALAERLAGSGVTYLVIDDGWAERPGDAFQQNGDWKVNRRAFPDGLKATTEAIRRRGLVPGIWFEFEVVNPGSAAWEETSHLLHRDGVPLQVGNRRFWDFRDPWVHSYLAQRVIARLREDGFGYLKVDYNDSIGPGVDGAESPGENLRQHLEGVQHFFARLRAEIPELVIENCSSGGHRLEPSMLALTAMSSFSDAHETPDIPLIAANLNWLVWSAQKQIWAVLRREDTKQRLTYSLAATFLGRMCLSGDLARLSAESWQFARDAIAFYQEVASVIRDGTFRCVRAGGLTYQHPTGHQIVTIHHASARKCLIVWHRFANADGKMTLALPAGESWQIVRELGDAPASATCAGGKVIWTDGPAWSGGVILLEPVHDENRRG